MFGYGSGMFGFKVISETLPLRWSDGHFWVNFEKISKKYFFAF